MSGSVREQQIEELVVHADNIGMQLERIADSLDKIVGYIERDLEEEKQINENK